MFSFCKHDYHGFKFRFKNENTFQIITSLAQECLQRPGQCFASLPLTYPYSKEVSLQAKLPHTGLVASNVNKYMPDALVCLLGTVPVPIKRSLAHDNDYCRVSDYRGNMLQSCQV